MFADDEEPKKTITMTMHDEEGERLTLTVEHPMGCSWMTIANQFHRFLAGQGYILDAEDVGGGY